MYSFFEYFPKYFGLEVSWIYSSETQYERFSYLLKNYLFLNQEKKNHYCMPGTIHLFSPLILTTDYIQDLRTQPDRSRGFAAHLLECHQALSS